VDSLQHWEEAHQLQDIQRLSGHSLDTHLRDLAVQLTPQDRVLCIGIGTGTWIRELAARVAKVHVYDISPTALQGVADVADTALPCNTADVALCLWVVPHMSDIQLAELLAMVLSMALAPSGYLAIHYNEELDSNAEIDNRVGQPDEWIHGVSGLMLRSAAQFAAIVRQAGGCICHRHVFAEHPELHMRCVTVHINKLRWNA
jgi:SAM-dependent methyltransferase